MLAIDVNVLVYAHRHDAVDHKRYLAWLDELINGGQPYTVFDVVLSGFLRIVTHPKAFRNPAAIDVAIAALERVRTPPVFVRVVPTERCWPIFTKLCQEGNARGNLVPDAWIAAMAIDTNSELITTDHGFARWPGLKWRTPF